MPDLSIEAVHKFWHDYNETIIYRVVAFMEGVETWTQDGKEEVETAMKTLSEELEGLGDHELGSESEFITVCSHLKTGRALRLLQSIDTAHPGAASKLLVYAEEKGSESEVPTALFLRRNIVFERMRLLTRVFSRDRFRLVLQAMEEEDETE